MKRLKGAAYDIGHHAQSGLSYLHPYIGELCAKENILEAELVLLEPNPYPRELARIEPLELSCLALQQKFISILDKMNLPVQEVGLVSLRFIFDRSRIDNSICSVETRLIKVDGSEYVVCVR